MNPQAYNAWKLVSLSSLPVWALAGLATLVVAGVVLAAMGLRREPLRSRRLWLWLLRIGAGLCAIFFLLEPGIRNLQVARVKNRVAVLVDRSASMGFPAMPSAGAEPVPLVRGTEPGRSAGGGSTGVPLVRGTEPGRSAGGGSTGVPLVRGTRSGQVAAALDAMRVDLAGLEDRFTVELYGFDPELTPLSIEALRGRPARAGRTDILSALRALKAGEQGVVARKLSGVLLFSDGADNVELASGAVGRARSALADLEVPVSTFLVGRENPKDLAIETVKVDDFAFVRNSLAVEVEIRGRGFKGQDVTVVLEREGQVVATKRVALESDDELKTVSFSFTPDQTGRFVYTASVPVFPDEAVTENNTRSFVLKIIRDRVRVLLVVGRPSWDERFLRGLLRQDANVDLISFYILRTMSDDPLVHNQERELSLIPFPMDEIFDTKLHTFDVVIFQNFGYTDPQLSIATYERNLEQYVHQGGGFVMIGGDRAFGEGRATFTTLANALPVEPAGQADLSEFRPRLTPDGLRHPVTALSSGAFGTEGVWSALPKIPGANLTRARPGATVLLDHPHLTADGKSAPILALWDYGRGRSMALTIDSSWYWAFTSHAGGSQSRHYDRFWGNALRWLVRDPDLTTLKITADPASVEPGRPVGVIVAARLPDYQPAAEAQVRVDLYAVQMRKVIASQTGTTGPDGVVRLEFEPPPPGAYKLLGSATKGEKALGEGEDAVAVRAVGPELSDASVRPDLLEQIAQVTGGRSFRLPVGSLPDVPLLDPPLVEVGRSKDQPLWDRWYYLVGFAALLGMEWMLRRRFGYI